MATKEVIKRNREAHALVCPCWPASRRLRGEASEDGRVRNNSPQPNRETARPALRTRVWTAVGCGLFGVRSTPSSHSKNSLSKICSKGWVAQAPFLIGNNKRNHYLRYECPRVGSNRTRILDSKLGVVVSLRTQTLISGSSSTPNLATKIC